MTRPRVLAEDHARVALNGTSLPSSKARPWFWIYERRVSIIRSLGTSPASTRDQSITHREVDSPAKITQKCI
jgi:hypothetical protein